MSNSQLVYFGGRKRLRFPLAFLAPIPTNFPLGAQLVDKFSLLFVRQRKHATGAVFALVKISVTPEKTPPAHLINKQRQQKRKDDEVDSACKRAQQKHHHVQH
ncbi:MAG: hypothetical protein JTJ11_02190 [Collinsella sp.]|nr:hypothetical protein [Collinsella sp.]